MTHVPHSLAEDFPEHLNTIATLKAVDLHFARLVDDYHNVNREVHRVEDQVTPASDDREIELRKTRARLKDQIWKMLREAETQLTS